MTKIEASRILGISRSAGSAKVEQAYRKKQKKLQLKLIPGMEKADRQKAQSDMAMLMTARDVFCGILSTSKPSPTKSSQRKTRRPKPRKAKPKATATNNYSKPQTLADAWDLMVTMLPFPQPVVTILFLLMFLFLILLLT